MSSGNRTVASALFIALVLSLAAPAAVRAQAVKEPVSETGAVLLWGDSGWTFGLPGVRAAVATRTSTSVSPERKNGLIAPSVGVGVRVSRFIVPFVEVGLFDTGKALASLGSLRSEVTSETWAVNGGVRFVGDSSRARPYAQVGGGALRQNLTLTFNGAPQSATGSATTIVYGAGVQAFAGKKWGTDIGVDGFHVSKPLDALARTGQNFARFRFGIFYQTKSSLP